MAERRTLTMHPELLMKVIRDQAGSLDKAVLEGVMNGAEAGAKRIDITFQDSILRITDAGKGISSRQEVEEFFEKFGTPHSVGERKVWAQFRMGRGQLFSYGRNIWRTATFRMIVDIKNHGLSYELEENLPFHEGCDIEVQLYRSPMIDYASPIAFKQSVARQVEFMPVEVYFNGELISTDPRNCKWTEEDEWGYYQFGAGNGLSIYNMGAYVRTYEAERFGCVGTVVSKQMLKVNFARTDVQSDCQVWQHLRDVIYQYRQVRHRKEARWLTPEERTALLIDIRDGNISEDGWKDAQNIGLLYTTNGKLVSLAGIRRETVPWTFAPKGHIFADNLLQSEAAVALDEAVLKSLSYRGEPEDFFTWLTSQVRKMYFSQAREAEKWQHLKLLYRPFEDLMRGVDLSCQILPEKQLTLKEKRVLRWLNDKFRSHNRRFCIGISQAAHGWTDGETFVAINRAFLSDLRLDGMLAAGDLMSLVFHELSHLSPSVDTHNHDLEFYRRYHDLTRKEMGYVCYLRDWYKAAAIEEKNLKAVQKAQEAEARRQRMLAKKTKPVNQNPVETQVGEATMVRPKGRKRKLPRGAMD